MHFRRYLGYSTSDSYDFRAVVFMKVRTTRTVNVPLNWRQVYILSFSTFMLIIILPLIVLSHHIHDYRYYLVITLYFIFSDYMANYCILDFITDFVSWSYYTVLHITFSSRYAHAFIQLKLKLLLVCYRLIYWHDNYYWSWLRFMIWILRING